MRSNDYFVELNNGAEIQKGTMNKALLLNSLRRCCKGLQPVARILSLDNRKAGYRLTVKLIFAKD
jgi:hypothetical protein